MADTHPSIAPSLRLSLPKAALLALVCGGCATSESSTDRAAPVDRHSRSRPHEVRVTHVDLDLTADFTSRSLSGTVRLEIDRADRSADLVLDSSPALLIQSVHGQDGSPRPFRLGEADPILGAALTIPLSETDEQVEIRYTTRPEAAAVQWLAPEQTAGGTSPFLFTQGQAILTRSWIPLQDSPGVRQTYEAVIRTPGAPQLEAVMSADARELLEPGVTRFSMSRPIPGYLIALAIGELERRELSPRSAVWAEPPVVEGAAAEFEDVEAMIQACESLYGEYVWGRYDVLVLPPSFPFGGMENPCTTFATPTILAGDKSLVALIAHELAHSWSGNLVTNATWDDFWLNEGFTVYVEQRIVEELFGVERSRAETAIGMQGLRKELEELPALDQHLVLDLGGRDPDDGMTAVAYDKGAALLRRLEEVHGRAAFDRFLAAWFEEHAFQSVTTADFRVAIQRQFGADPGTDLDAWLHGPGLPGDTPAEGDTGFGPVDAARDAWLGGGPLPDPDGFETVHWLHLLGSIPADVDRGRLAELDAAFHLTDSTNAEVLFAWLMCQLRVGYADLPPAVDARIGSFLHDVGRRKFVEPLYRSLSATPEGRARALSIYATARPRYHSVTSRSVDAFLAPAEGR
jgi:leukotriene-A4 hydrolase